MVSLSAMVIPPYMTVFAYVVRQPPIVDFLSQIGMKFIQNIFDFLQIASIYIPELYFIITLPDVSQVQ